MLLFTAYLGLVCLVYFVEAMPSKLTSDDLSEIDRIEHAMVKRSEGKIYYSDSVCTVIVICEYNWQPN